MAKQSKSAAGVAMMQVEMGLSSSSLDSIPTKQSRKSETRILRAGAGGSTQVRECYREKISMAQSRNRQESDDRLVGNRG